MTANDTVVKPGFVWLEEPKLNDITEIPNGGSMKYVDRTGKTLQGGGVQTEHVFRAIPVDTPDAIKQSLIARYRSEGWGQADGITVTGLPSAQVWALPRIRYEALQRRKADGRTPQEQTSTQDFGGISAVAKSTTKRATYTKPIKDIEE